MDLDSSAPAAWEGLLALSATSRIKADLCYEPSLNAKEKNLVLSRFGTSEQEIPKLDSGNLFLLGLAGIMAGIIPMAGVGTLTNEVGWALLAYGVAIAVPLVIGTIYETIRVTKARRLRKRHPGRFAYRMPEMADLLDDDPDHAVGNVYALFVNKIKHLQGLIGQVPTNFGDVFKERVSDQRTGALLWEVVNDCKLVALSLGRQDSTIVHADAARERVLAAYQGLLALEVEVSGILEERKAAAEKDREVENLQLAAAKHTERMLLLDELVARRALYPDFADVTSEARTLKEAYQEVGTNSAERLAERL